MQGLADGGMINRLNSKVLKAISSNKLLERGKRDLHGADFTHLENFEFNINSPLQKYLMVKPTVAVDENRYLHVHVPQINVKKDLRTPDRYTVATIKTMVVAFSFKKLFYHTCGTHEIAIRNTVKVQEASDWTCPVQMPPDCVVLVTMLLQYTHTVPFMDTITLNSKELSPSAIIAAFETPDGPEREGIGTADFRYPLQNYKGEDLVRE